MPETRLNGTLERITYVSEADAWTVARLRPDGADQSVPIVGRLYNVSPGERLRLDGEWVTDAQYGRQFRFTSYATLQPATVEGIRRYLASGLIEGIGEALAGRLVERFGEQTLEVIEDKPRRLREVEGIGPTRATRIRAAYMRNIKLRDLMVFLHSHGVSASLGARIIDRYGDEAIDIVRADPYRLATDIWGVGFLTADRIARRLGIEPNSPTRAQAGLLHCLSEAAGAGHVYLPRGALLDSGEALLETDRDLLEQALAALAARRAIVEDPQAGDGAVYLPALHRAETGAATALLRLVGREERMPKERIEGWLRLVEQEMGLGLANQQREALAASLRSRVLVVTGGPGTGKTTIIRGILSLFRRRKHAVALAAPTGRASRRLQEASGHAAATIHRLLEFSPREGRFQRDADDPLDIDAVILDEASMLDISLFHAVLQALPLHARLVLVGDADQLPSVGPGSVLADLVRSRAVPVVRLDEVFRQSQQSGIVRNAHRINRGEELESNPTADLADFYVVEKDVPEEILGIVRRLIGERIPQRFGIDPLREVQVLAPMHRGVLGCDNLNRELQALLNPKGRPIPSHGGRFRVGDKVMQIRNNYDKEVFNGDVGQVVGYDAEERLLSVAFDGREVVYERKEGDELVLAYAVSVHKSQGSEYPAVVLPLHTQHYVMLQRNLLYTAVTRGRRLVVIVGSPRAVRLAIANDKMAFRHTHLAERLGRPAA